MGREQEQPVDTENTAQSTDADAGAAEATEEQQLREELAALKDQNTRLVAEMRNVKQRAEREKLETVRFAEGDFAKELLLVVDDLERTLQSGQAIEAAAPVVDGVRIVLASLLKVFKSRGIEPVDAAGARFDPELHEALLQQPSDAPAGTVVQEVARGYRMRERVLRPAKVIVSSGQE